MSAATVGDIVADGLRRAGARHLFVTAATAASGLATLAGRHRLTPVVAATVEAAALMAAVSGEVGGGPGVVAAADADRAAMGVRYAVAGRAPMIVVTPVGGDSALTPLVKGVVTVDAASAARWVAHAVQLALTEPRGPVQLVMAGGSETMPALPVAAAVRPSPPPPATDALDRAARLLAPASRPVIVVGLECRSADAARWVRPLAESLPAPVVTTLRGKGVMPDPHPLAFGLIGGRAAATLLERADLIVELGVDTGEVGEGSWPAPVLRIGPTPAAAARAAAGEVVGDVALVLEELAPRLKGRTQADWDVAELDRLKRLTQAAGPPRDVLTAARVIALARELTPAGTIAAVGPVAEPGAVAAAWPAVGPNELLLAPDVPGFALSAALAAALADTDRRVVCVTTGAPAELAELDTVTRLAPSVVVIVLDDGPGAAGVADELRLGAAFARAMAAAGPAVVRARVGRGV